MREENEGEREEKGRTEIGGWVKGEICNQEGIWNCFYWKFTTRQQKYISSTQGLSAGDSVAANAERDA